MPFDTILGQDHAVGVLRRSRAAGRVSHAYLFEGIAGCGKMLTACALVEALFCDAPEPCGSCPACRKMAKLQHPDLHILEPDKGVIRIDQIRELQRELSLRPVEAPKKACIVSAADRMNQSAANAFLKTLEEPPGDAVIILLSDNPTALLTTVLSRCQRLRFSPLPGETVVRLLERKGVSPDAARFAAALSDGSMEKALGIAQEEALARRKEVVEQVLALPPREFAPLTSLAERLGSDREEARMAVEILTTFFRDVLLLICGSRELVNGDIASLVERSAARLTLRGTLGRLDALLTAGQDLVRNVHPRLALETLFLTLSEES